MHPDFKKMVRKMGHRKAAKMGITPEMVQGRVEETQSWEGNGGCFRFLMYFGIIAVFILLVYMNVDREYAAGGHFEKMLQEGPKDSPVLNDEHLSTLNLKKEDGTAEKINKQELEEKFKKLFEEYNNPDCPDCATKLVQLREAHSALSTHVDINAFEVLNVKPKMKTNEIRKARDTALASIAAGESKYDLAQINQAYDLLATPLARQYYDMYGVAPPEWVKHQRESTHGGWGVEFGTDKWRTTMLKGVIDYFDDLRLEVGLAVLAISIILYKAYSSRKMLTDLTEQYFENEEMAAEAKEEEEKLLKEEEDREEARLAKAEAKAEKKAAKAAKRRH